MNEGLVILIILLILGVLIVFEIGLLVMVIKRIYEGYLYKEKSFILVILYLVQLIVTILMVLSGIGTIYKVLLNI